MLTAKDKNLILEKYLKKNFPDVIESVNSIIRESMPKETDFSKIPYFLVRFFEFNKLNASDLIGKKKDRIKANHWRHFIAAMIFLYYPLIINHRYRIRLKQGFLKTLSNALGEPNTWVIVMISESEFLFNNDSDFKESVIEFVETL